VGNRGGSNIGESFARSCPLLGTSFEQIESRFAFEGASLLRRARWHLLGRTPLRLERFSDELVDACVERRPRLLLSVGIAPVNRSALEKIAALGCVRAVYLTDDPWSRAQKAKWFISALPCYDFAFTTRRANLEDLKKLGIPHVSYLPFGWDPALCEEALTQETQDDIVFAGGADAERLPYINALHKAGFRVALYGTYWDRFAPTRKLTRGQLPASELPRAIAAARISLCLVRRANRDGHSMRTYEVAAMGGCILAEDTEEHREILGPDGEAAVYFRSIEEMIRKAHWLIENPALRARLTSAARIKIRIDSNTYQHRLHQILKTCCVV